MLKNKISSSGVYMFDVSTNTNMIQLYRDWIEKDKK
jgi:hypothetical protein